MKNLTKINKKSKLSQQDYIKRALDQQLKEKRKKNKIKNSVKAQKPARARYINKTDNGEGESYSKLYGNSSKYYQNRGKHYF